MERQEGEEVRETRGTPGLRAGAWRNGFRECWGWKLDGVTPKCEWDVKEKR